MAIFTQLSLADADRLCRAHGLDAALSLQSVPQGSVNSNYLVGTAGGPRFLRVYEQQGPEGVRYEWALLEHMARCGIPVPRRVPCCGPELAVVEGKPVALFDLAPGQETCQAGVSPGRAHALGRGLALAHVAGASFASRRHGRFESGELQQRLRQIRGTGRPELTHAADKLGACITAYMRELPSSLPGGVIHGDLFRDNVRWEADRIVCLLDWESASDGVLAYDVMVAVLAWSHADAFSWQLARAVVDGYQSVRPLAAEELAALRALGIAAAVRFATTRITDFELRGSIGDRVSKDYRRFLARLDVLLAASAAEVTRLLAG